MHITGEVIAGAGVKVDSNLISILVVDQTRLCILWIDGNHDLLIGGVCFVGGEGEVAIGTGNPLVGHCRLVPLKNIIKLKGWYHKDDEGQNDRCYPTADEVKLGLLSNTPQAGFRKYV